MIETNPFITKLERRFVLATDVKTALQSATAHVHTIGPRTDLIRGGDTPEHLHLILHGFACRYKIASGGERCIISYLIPGDICDLNVSALGAMDYSIRTLSACEVMRIPHEVIDDLTTRYPILDRALRWCSAVEEAISREWLINVGRRVADQRIAHLLCEMLVRFNAINLVTTDSYNFPTTQADLGDATGLTVVHVNRVLQRLRNDKLIVFKERKVHVLDVNGLARLARFDQGYLHLTST